MTMIKTNSSVICTEADWLELIKVQEGSGANQPSFRADFLSLYLLKPFSLELHDITQDTEYVMNFDHVTRVCSPE